jgi:very-short-patch-repair endonuclease
MPRGEAQLWNMLRLEPFKELHFRRQVPIGPYYADFASHRIRMIIEVDGSQHMENAAIRHDEARTSFLRSRGYKVVRVFSTDVIRNLSGVLDLIAHEAGIAWVAPPPTAYGDPPSPQGGGSSD